ncbi:uncharacterized protein YjbI with pentapeptide repeats [Amycolatopsis bartoniae]|uniref:Pentapeptide repeat-containing protein n=1 Tax=Amycolatopsis bartoniae TaxID=941986 RepID=A0A8H9MFR6_9PSEU|nr:pentapeptide repeat-containing protein [Amycolatopsis bartoniae]MBB2935067.1 uncharacterized protein YjbI with pentapeptide repeats [Amycolatopsis bartoniae]GHF74100.1 hypothetical protein GCM10017566_54830 [Amycolatopsis bartoniae]
MRPISGWLLLPALVLVVVVTWLVYVVATHLAGPGVGPSDRIDIVKITLSTAAGTGGAVALLLTFRRQRTSEITGAHTIQDATSRRITELYTKAVEQLGSDKGAVRLGGLYALERLAQDNPDQRQTIVNVLCAYLRMPHTPPPAPPQNVSPRPGTSRQTRRPVRLAGTTAAAQRASDQLRRQEHEVRLTAQRILERHLQVGDNPRRPLQTFWADLDLDLTGAVLTGINLSHCRVRTGRFTGVTFTGDASFTDATFTEDASFDDATFTGEASFTHATFTGDASFTGVTFTRGAWFDGVTFTGHASFEDVTFTGDASFTGVTFTGGAWFGGVTFTGHASFEDVTFTGGASFTGVTFTRGASFDEAAFTGGASFTGVTFTGDAWFDGVTFTGYASFTRATFTRDASFDDATFTGHASFDGVTFTGGAGFGGTLSKAAAWDFTGARVTQDAVHDSTWPAGWGAPVLGEARGTKWVLIERVAP